MTTDPKHDALLALESLSEALVALAGICTTQADSEAVTDAVGYAAEIRRCMDDVALKPTD